MRWYVNHRPGATIGRHSLSHALRACQLPQRGSRDGAVPFNVPPGNRERAGDFHRPYETQEFLDFTIHRSTLPQSRPAGVPAPSEREPGWGCTIQRTARKPEACGRFSSPLRRRIYPFTVQRTTAPSEREPGRGGLFMGGGQVGFGGSRPPFGRTWLCPLLW